MSDPSGNPLTAEAGPFELAGFGFHDADDRWMQFLRAAEAPASFGAVGGYEITEEIRRGGQGVVYRARCRATGRVVALKRLISGPLAPPAMRARFEREIAALRTLQHPNIVTALALDSFRDLAVLAMEWVDGVPITRWAVAQRGERGGPPTVTRMMLKVCDAVGHAHQRGLMHRDLKPSNILIDARGEPRVLDFGLAKATWNAPQPGEDVTCTDQFVGTVAYASPEQLRGRPEEIDTRTDFYSMGVMLYEMLTGERPYPTRDGVAAALQAIERGDARRPRSFDRRIPADLEAVTLKAMHADRAARYQSADAFADDLRSVLNGTPVAARGYSGWGHLVKIVRRHRLAAAFAATVFVLVCAFGICAAVFADRFARQRDLAVRTQESEAEARRAAERERRKAEVVGQFLQDMLAQADPARGGGRGVTVREVLDSAARQLASPATAQWDTQPALRMVIGRTYWNLGALEEAQRQMTAALAGLRQLHGDGHAAVFTALCELGNLLHAAGNQQDARAIALEAFECADAMLGRDELPTGEDLSNLAMLLCTQGRGDQAEWLYGRVLVAHRQRLGDRHLTVAEDLNGLAGVLSGRGKYAHAEALQREALSIDRQLLGERHPRVAEDLHHLALTVDAGGSPQDAEPLFRQALELYTSLGNRRGVEGARILLELAGLLMRLHRLDEAEPVMCEALEVHIERFGDDHLEVAECRARLGRLLDRKGDHAGAETHLREVLASFRKHLRSGHWRTAGIAKDLGACLTALGRFEEAEALLLEAFDGSRSAPRYRRDEHAKTIQCLITLYQAWGRPAEADQYNSLHDAAVRKWPSGRIEDKSRRGIIR